MFKIIIKTSANKFEPVIEISDKFRLFVKTNNGFWNKDTRKYQLDLQHLDAFEAAVRESAIEFVMKEFDSTSKNPAPKQRTTRFSDNQQISVRRKLDMDSCSNKQMDPCQIKISSDHIKFYFGYLDELVQLVKTIPDREFVNDDNNKHWRLPADKLDMLCQKLKENDFPYSVEQLL